MVKKVIEDKKVKLHFGCGNNYLNDWINIDDNSNNDIRKLDLNWDLKNPLPFKENCVDIIYDENFLERLRQEDAVIESFLRCFRCILKPKGHLKIFLPDIRHKEKLEPWLKGLGFTYLGFYDDLANIKLKNAGKMKLHVGCGTNYFDGWVNIDNNSDNNIKKLDLNFDLRNPLPFEENSVDYIYNEHFLEHLSIEEGLRTLRDFKRILKPNGTLRIAMPDLENSVKDYFNPDWKDNPTLKKYGLDFIKTKAEKINISFRWWGHKWLYDWEELERRLKEAGFTDIKRCKLRESKKEELRNLETREESTLIAEANNVD